MANDKLTSDAILQVDNNGQGPVPPVPPVPPQWPPAWLAPAANPSTEGGEGADVPCGAAGWQLPSGMVICGCCHHRPLGAVAVRLERRAEGDLSWQVVPETSASPTGSTMGDPTSIPHVGGESAPLTNAPKTNRPQWL